MANRLNLDTELRSVLGTNNVYFQPPSSYKLTYPCIIYSLDRIDGAYADDITYFMNDKYMITLVHRDPDNTVVHSLLQHFKMIRFDRSYQADNLYHYVFSLYY